MSHARALGVHVAVVTFSPQVPMIRAVLNALLPDHAASIPIRGADRTWVYEGRGSHDGKQPHMASAVEEILAAEPGAAITRRSTLLVDDDANNIKVALSEGVRAIWLNPREEGRLLGNIKELLS